MFGREWHFFACKRIEWFGARVAGEGKPNRKCAYIIGFIQLYICIYNWQLVFVLFLSIRFVQFLSRFGACVFRRFKSGRRGVGKWRRWTEHLQTRSEKTRGEKKIVCLFTVNAYTQQQQMVLNVLKNTKRSREIRKKITLNKYVCFFFL